MKEINVNGLMERQEQFEKYQGRLLDLINSMITRVADTVGDRSAKSKADIACSQLEALQWCYSVVRETHYDSTADDEMILEMVKGQLDQKGIKIRNLPIDN